MKKKIIISTLISSFLLPCSIVPLFSLTSCSDTSLFSPTQTVLVQGNNNQSIYMNINERYLDQQISFVEYSFKYFNAETDEEYSTRPTQIISTDSTTGTITLSDYSKELNNDIIVEVNGKAIIDNETYEHSVSVILKKDHPKISFDEIHTTIYERIGSNNVLHSGVIQQTKELRNFIIDVESNELNNYSSAKIIITGKLLDNNYKFVNIYEIEQDSGYKIGLNIDPNVNGSHPLNSIKIDIEITVSLLDNNITFVKSIWVQPLA